MSNSSVANIIIETADRYGLPAWIPLDIARRESGLNPNSVGDNGSSFGLFQLHRGGLAPSSRTDEELKDPAINADIGIRGMLENFKRGQSAGLTGYELEEYTANMSGWPGQLGPAWTNKNRPDYNSALKRIYADDASEQYITAYGGPSANDAPAATYEAQSITTATQPDTHYDDNTYHSPAATVFRKVAEAEHVQSFSEWSKGRAWYEKIVPLNYMAENAGKIGVRSLLILIGLLFVAFAIFTIVKDNEAKLVGGLVGDGASAPEAKTIPGEAAAI